MTGQIGVNIRTLTQFCAGTQELRYQGTKCDYIAYGDVHKVAVVMKALGLSNQFPSTASSPTAPLRVVHRHLALERVLYGRILFHVIF